MRVGVVIHKDGDWYVAIDPVTGVASQGKSVDEALRNFQEAFELWFGNAEPWEKERAVKGEPVATMVVELKCRFNNDSEVTNSKTILVFILNLYFNML